MSKKVLLVTGDAVEALEIYYPYYRLLEENMEAVIAAPSAKKLHTVSHDFTDWETYVEKPAYLVQAHVSFAEVNPEDYDGLIIPGGRAPEYIRLDPALPDIVAHFFKENKPVAVLCHGVQVLESVRDVVKHRSMTAYIACKPSVEALNCTYISEHLHVDGNLVSGHAWPDLPSVMREFLKQLRG